MASPVAVSPLKGYIEIRVDPRPGPLPHRLSLRHQPPERLSPRRLSQRRLPWIRIALGSTILVAGLTCLAQEPSSDAVAGSLEPFLVAATPAPELAAPAPLWRPIGSPSPLYTLDAPELKGAPAEGEARRHARGGREDLLRFGTIEATTAPYLALRVSRLVGDPGPSSTLFVDLVRQAAGAGLAVMRSRQSAMVTSKFGPVEVAAVDLAAGPQRACLGFRLLHPEVGFRLQGWLCGEGERPTDPAMLACVLDRLALANPAEDPALKVLFAQGERHKTPGCATPPRLVASSRKAG